MPSQIDFDLPPIYDALLNPLDPRYLNNIWVGYWSSFIQTLVSYLSQNGIFLPQLTLAERNALQNITNGQMIYNIDPGIDAPQFWQASSVSWKTFLFV